MSNNGCQTTGWYVIQLLDASHLVAVLSLINVITYRTDYIVDSLTLASWFVWAAHPWILGRSATILQRRSFCGLPRGTSSPTGSLADQSAPCASWGFDETLWLFPMVSRMWSLQELRMGKDPVPGDRTVLVCELSSVVYYIEWVV